MSASVTTPLLADVDIFDPKGTLHGAESTLVDSDSVFSCTSRNARNWVPDPSSKLQGRARTLVLCFDGTGDQFGDDNSNVVQFVSCLKKDNDMEQLVYYQAGIGTYTKDTFVSPLTNQVSKVLDEMIAWNLSSHVKEGYEYLMQNYKAGDKIAIFGFSRGAYTARALAGMIQKVGLLPRYNHAQIPFAWAMYTREDKDGFINSEAFKKTFSTDVVIDFVGVWDTVASVGLTNKELPFVADNTAIRIFRHAICLDEHRAKFMPAFYKVDPKAEPFTAKTDGTLSIISASMLLPASGDAPPEHSIRPMKMHVHRSETQQWEDDVNSEKGSPTDALEVWFSGCHCDVGGGSVPNGTRNSLARIPLRWMIRECFKNEVGIIFDKDMLKEFIGIDADTLYPVVLPRGPRKPAPIRAQFQPMLPQGFAITGFLAVVGSLIALPIKVALGIIAWPLKHIWLLLKFTNISKWIRYVVPKVENNSQASAENYYGMTSALRNSPSVATTFKSEEDEELADALTAEYDQLSIRWFWWILEIIPFRFRDQKGKRDDFFVRANWGRGRKIYGDALKSGLKVHRSVKTRLEVLNNEGKSIYRPRAWFKYRNSSNRKVVGPETWDVDQPDLWEWVD